MTSKEFDEFCQQVAELAPDIWRKVYPRYYGDVSGGYLSLRVPAAVLVSSILSRAMLRTRPGSDPGIDAALFTVGLLAQHNMPVFYVAKEFMQAVLLSDVPSGLGLADIPLPMPAATFMLPLGMFKHPEEGDVGFISYAYHESGEFDDYLTNNLNRCDGNTFITVTATHEQAIPPLFHMVLTDTIPSELTVDGLSATMKRHEFIYTEYRFGGLEAPSDQSFNNQMTNLCLRLLLAMSAAPEMVERGKNTGKRLSGQGLPIWTPNVIGRSYRLPRPDPKGGTHASPRWHWRRGHFTQQPHGPNNSLRRTHWRKPVVINLHLEEE